MFRFKANSGMFANTGIYYDQEQYIYFYPRLCDRRYTIYSRKCIYIMPFILKSNLERGC